MEVELQNFPTWLPPLSIMLLLFLGNGGYGTLIWVSQTKPPHVAASSLNYAASLPWQWWIRNTKLGKPIQISPSGCHHSWLSNCSLKGRGLRDGLKLSCQSWVNLGLKKDLGRFLNFLDASFLWKNIYIFLAVNVNPALLDFVICVYLVIILCFLMASTAGVWFPLAGQMCEFIAGIFDHSMMLRISRKPSASHSTFIIG